MDNYWDSIWSSLHLLYSTTFSHFYQTWFFLEDLALDQLSSLIDIFFYSHHLFAWYGIDIVRRNSVFIRSLMGVKGLNLRLVMLSILHHSKKKLKATGNLLYVIEETLSCQIAQTFCGLWGICSLTISNTVILLFCFRIMHECKR